MVLQAVHSWDLCGLIGAFLDLALAYILLCVSVFAFFASKFLSFFGLLLPCTCSGIFGYKNSHLCFHSLLFDWPTGIIFSVLNSVLNRFPFDLIWFKDRACNSDKKSVRDGNCENRVLELENEASCSLFPRKRLQNLADRESGYDARGKGVMNLKQRSGFRRRRRATFDNKKFSSVLSSDYSRSVVAGNSIYDGSEMRSKTSESLGPASGREDGFLGECNDLNLSSFSFSFLL